MMLLLTHCAPRVKIAGLDPAQLASCPSRAEFEAAGLQYAKGVKALPLEVITLPDGRIVTRLETVNARSFVETGYIMYLRAYGLACHSTTQYARDWQEAALTGQ